MKKFKLINLTDSINEKQADEVLTLFREGYKVETEYVFQNSAVIIMSIDA